MQRRATDHKDAKDPKQRSLRKIILAGRVQMRRRRRERAYYTELLLCELTKRENASRGQTVGGEMRMQVVRCTGNAMRTSRFLQIVGSNQPASQPLSGNCNLKKKTKSNKIYKKLLLQRLQLQIGWNLLFNQEVKCFLRHILPKRHNTQNCACVLYKSLTFQMGGANFNFCILLCVITIFLLREFNLTFTTIKGMIIKKPRLATNRNIYPTSTLNL